MALAAHIVGRASELGSVDRLLAEIGAGGSAALELVGSYSQELRVPASS